MADSTFDLVQALVNKGILTEEEGLALMKGTETEKRESKKKSISTNYKDGLTFESGNGDFSFTPIGRVHADYRIYDYNEGKNNAAAVGAGNSVTLANPQAAGSDTFDIRRARLGFKTKYKEYYEAELNADISTGANTSVSSTAWDVAYFNVAWWKEAQFRFGLFKMPMNLEELTSSNNIDFMERSYVNALAPTKEIGAMLHGSPTPGVTYALAVSNGNGKNVETDLREDGKDVIGRVTANIAEMLTVPNKEAIFHVGVSYSQGDLPLPNAATTVGVAGRTESRGIGFFKAPQVTRTTTDSIDRSRFGLEGAVALKQFKVQAEWMKQNNEFSTATRKYDLDTDNWYVEGLWAITGENYADGYKNGVMGAIKPLKDFNPVDFSGGAWEIGLRYNKFDASDYNSIGLDQGAVKGAADAQVTTKAGGFAEAESYTAGIKFLPNSNMRFMLNYVKTNFDNPIGGATGGIVLNNKRIDDEQAVIMRTQWMF
ncbi:MAG TPA: hypothetical protein DCO68_01995 [Methylophilaceae bacterium]|nr:hypothetical protein [Methylophilaceae bacterium]